MKKVFLLLVLFSMVACEQDDNDGVAINEANIAGKWYFESSRLNDDDYQLYSHSCTSKHDYVELLADGSAKTVEFMSNCTASPDQPATWTLDGTTLTYTSAEVGAESIIYEVKILTDYKLSLVETTELPDSEFDIQVVNFSRY